MIRATLDTNVLASGLAALDKMTSTPGAILRSWIDGRYELVLSPAIQAELERTLTKPYFSSRRSSAQIEAAIRLIASEATIIVPTITVSGVTTHPEDDLVLGAAIAGGVDYLVTGDKQIQRLDVVQGVIMFTPRAFLELLEMAGDSDQ